MKKFPFALLFAMAFSVRAATPLPGDSVLQVNHTFTNQNVRDFKLNVVADLNWWRCFIPPANTSVR